MKAVYATIPALVLAAALLYLWYGPTGPDTCPDIAVPTLDGNKLQLEALRGRPLLVTFWATSCPGCLRELPHLISLYEELAPHGLEIIAIAMAYDPPSRVLDMRNARRIPYPVALDLDSAAARAFGDVRLTPTSFLIAPDGRIVYRRTGEMDMDRLHDDILAMLEPARISQHKIPLLATDSLYGTCCS